MKHLIMAVEIIFGLVDMGFCDICWSFILEVENRRNPYLVHRDYVSVLSRSCKMNIQPTQEIRDLANFIASNSSIKPQDALHVASAICSNAEYFITCG